MTPYLVSGHVADAATTFWQSLRQINMASGAIAALPANPLSLLPYEEPSFYVHPVYCQMWKIISTRTDTGAVKRQF